MNKRHLDHATVVFGRLLEAREDTAGLLEPTDQALNDVPSAIRVTVKLDGTDVSVLVLPGGNDGPDAQIDQVLVNPVGPVSLVASQGYRPRYGFALAVKHMGVGLFQQRVEDGRFMCLSRRKMEVQRMALPVAQNMDFRRKTPAGSA